MNKEILFRAKLKDWKTNPEHNQWIEGFYLKRKETTYCFAEDYEKYPVKTLHFISEECMTDWGLPNDFRLYEIDPDTLCQFIGWDDKHKTKIFENDVIEIAGKTFYRYLLWWNKEMNMMTALSIDDISFNGSDYWNGNFKFTYQDFCLMLQDPYGDFSDIKVIGNIIDHKKFLNKGENRNE